MATTIQGNVCSVIPIEYHNAGGQPCPPPSGDTITVQSDSPGVDAMVEENADGSRQLVVTPAQPPQDGATATVTITDQQAGGGKTLTVSETFTVAASSNAADSMVLRLDQMTTRPLPSRGGARVVLSRG